MNGILLMREMNLVKYPNNGDDFLAVEKTGLFDFFEVDFLQVNEHISMQKTAAHTPGHSMILIENEHDLLLFPSDIIPTSHHVKLNWTCSYDYHSYEVLEQKRNILKLAYERDAIVYLVHECIHPLGKVKKDDSGEYYWQPLDEHVL